MDLQTNRSAIILVYPYTSWTAARFGTHVAYANTRVSNRIVPTVPHFQRPRPDVRSMIDDQGRFFLPFAELFHRNENDV